MENKVVNLQIKDGELVVNGGKSAEIVINKFAKSVDFKWKSARNSFADRLNNDIPYLIVGGVGLFVALSTTYLEFDLIAQCIAYTVTFSFMLVADPLHLSRRLLSMASRWLIFIHNTLFLAALIIQKNSLWLVYLIVLLITIILVFFLNTFWLRSESWRMSREVEHALHGDDNNRAMKSWQAEGRDNTRTILYSLGHSVTDDELDSIMKSAYSVGYWNCLKFATDQEEKIVQLNSTISKQKDILSKCKERLSELEGVASENAILKDQVYAFANHNNTLAKKLEEIRMEADKEAFDNIEIEIQEIIEGEVEKEIEDNDFEIIPGVKKSQYEEVLDLLSKGESKRSIERIVGISRHYIDKIIKSKGELN